MCRILHTNLGLCYTNTMKSLLKKKQLCLVQWFTCKCLELCPLSLVPRPSHCPVFDRYAVCKSGGRRPGIFHHVNDVSVYLGRQRRGGEGCPIEWTSSRPYLVVSAPSAEVSNVHEAKSILLLVQNEKRVCKMHSFDMGKPENEKVKTVLVPGYEPTQVWMLQYCMCLYWRQYSHWDQDEPIRPMSKWLLLG